MCVVKSPSDGILTRKKMSRLTVRRLAPVGNSTGIPSVNDENDDTEGRAKAETPQAGHLRRYLEKGGVAANGW